MYEVYYLDVMKTLCNMLNRLFDKKGITERSRSILRDVKYWDGEYHYTEKVWNVIIYWISVKFPCEMMKQIIERANQKVF